MIPSRLLKRLIDDSRVPIESRESFARTLLLDEKWRRARDRSRLPLPLTSVSTTGLPSQEIYDCAEFETLPGNRVDPTHSTDSTVLRASDWTKRFSVFLEQCFGRNSIDGKGKTLVSSVHFSRSYSNAYWDSELLQMVYGDGDGLMLLDFTLSPEFIGHEITHGTTQFTTQLKYADESGALNESISDVFGSMFVQWCHGQEVTRAHWQIGPDLVGPVAHQLGWMCVRDLANPGARHSMTQQPSSYDNYIPHGDPHDNSGIPNHAFYLAAMELGGRVWERLGPVWYATITDTRAHSNMTISEFARLTVGNAIALFPTRPMVAIAIAKSWLRAKVPL